MGANNSTRRVSFESDENENVTVVKGIRLSENVINRMKEPASPPKHRNDPSAPPSKSPLLSSPPPVLQAVPPLSEPITSLPPPPPFVEPVASQAPPPPSSPSATETVAVPPPPPPQQVAAPAITEMVLPSPWSLPSVNSVAAPPPPPPPPPPPAAPPLTTPPATNNSLISATDGVEGITLAPPSHVASHEPLAAPSVALSSVAEPIPPPLTYPITKSDPLPSPPLIEHVASLSPPAHPSGDSLSPQTSEPFVAPPLPDFTAPSEPIAPPSQAPVSSPPVSKPVVVPQTTPVTPPAKPAVDEAALRKKITDELYQGLEQERAKADKELQAWLQAEKARASEQAHAEAQSQVQDEVSRILSAERTLPRESIQQAVIRERIATEDERLRAQLYAKQLEAREADLRKQDAYYRDQLSRLEERTAQFYKVTSENYHKAADQVNAKFKRYEVYPVCADLQGQILACYKENLGKTLHCSNIAALYLQCVNNAKQNKLRTGG